MKGAATTCTLSEHTQALFWAKVRKTDTCWLWTGANNGRKGYGLFYPAGQPKIYAHRLAYILAHGSVPDGMVIDHLCVNPSCVNPDHLEATTNRENLALAGVPEANSLRNRHDPIGAEQLLRDIAHARRASVLGGAA